MVVHRSRKFSLNLLSLNLGKQFCCLQPNYGTTCVTLGIISQTKLIVSHTWLRQANNLDFVTPLNMHSCIRYIGSESYSAYVPQKAEKHLSICEISTIYSSLSLLIARLVIINFENYDHCDHHFINGALNFDI